MIVEAADYTLAWEFEVDGKDPGPIAVVKTRLITDIMNEQCDWAAIEALARDARIRIDALGFKGVKVRIVSISGRCVAKAAAD